MRGNSSTAKLRTNISPRNCETGACLSCEKWKNIPTLQLHVRNSSAENVLSDVSLVWNQRWLFFFMFRACFQLLFSSLLFLYFCCLFTLRGWHFGECATLLSILLSLSRLKVMATGQHSHPVAIISQTTSPASPASRDFCGEYVSFQEHSAGRLGDLGKTLRGLSRKPSFIRVRPSWRVRKMSDDRTRQLVWSLLQCSPKLWVWKLRL